MADVATNRCSFTLGAAITSSGQTAITRADDTDGLPGDSNGPASGTYKFVMTDGTNYEIAQVTGGQGTTSLTIARAVEAIGGVQTALSSVPDGTVCYAVRTAGDKPVVGQTHTYSVAGLLAVASGATNFLPPFYYHVVSGTTVKLVGVMASVRGGTSCTLAVNQNGSAVSSLSALTATTTPTYTACGTPPSVSDEDAFAPVIASISGTPDGLSLSLFFEVTL